VGQHLVLIVDRPVVFHNVNHQAVVGFKTVEQMQTVALTDRNRGDLITRCAPHKEQAATMFWLPTESLHEGQAVMPQRFHVQDIRAQIEDHVVRAQTTVVYRTGILELGTFAIEELCGRAKAIDIEPWPRWREGNAKIKHLPGRGIQLRMSGKRTDVVQLSPEGAGATRLERHRIEFPW